MERQVPATLLIAAFDGSSVEVRHLSLCDLPDLRLGDGATLSLLGSPEPFVDADSLQNEGRGGGVLVTKVKATVGIDRDDYGDLETNLILGALVELFDELGDIDAVLTESRTDGGMRSLSLPEFAV